MNFLLSFLILIPFALTQAGQKVTTKTHVVKMEGMKFSPKSIEIHVNDVVRWTNETNGEHNVVENKALFKSEMMNRKGESFEFKFTKPGVYHYYCQPHKVMGMKGTIVVL